MFPNHRVLFIDAYDSFSNNIIALLEEECGVKVTRIYIDASIPDFEDFLLQFSAVVCGPGPGHPACLQDVGLFKKIWTLPDDRVVPVLGICLGFQSLAHEFGASTIRLPQPRHGIKTSVTSSSTSIFEGLSTVDTVQYHSLQVLLGRNTYRVPSGHHLWVPSEQCPQLQPLAWDFSSQDGVDPEFNKNPPSILMAAKHITKPFFGIQFHPESICSEKSAKKIIANWWQMALAWSPKLKPMNMMVEGARSLNFETENGSDDTSPRTSLDSTASRASESYSFATTVSLQEKVDPKVISATFPLGSLNVPLICEALDLPASDLIVLDAEMRQLPQLGEASIIGVILPYTKKIQYSVGKHEVHIKSENEDERTGLEQYDNDVFKFLQSFISGFAIERDDDRAFCGGLMGYISYEACLETLDISAPTPAGRPDLCFAFVERSILIDHRHQVIHVQGLHYDDLDPSASKWVNDISSILESLSQKGASASKIHPLSLSTHISHKMLPEESEYKSKISQCQELISAGESYELCLTDQTSVTLNSHISEWSMYKHLRSLNPANFGAYVRLGPLSLLSTSPERFMKWSRFQKPCATHSNRAKATEQTATCQFRPMKGTVRKRQEMPDGSVHQLSREEATEILAKPKEQAENLMILDLIRHDLHSVCQKVSVPDLMVVEDYDSVYQMVSVIEGEISKPLWFGPGEGKSGIDCLAASLPPGSMTGAPKKRSCQLLRDIGEKPRSIYSGVLGYIDVSGKGDFSVLIRSMYKWDDECGSDSAKWNIGAGGAVTTLSTEDGEWEEMLTKLQSTYRLFES